ncbi:MAG: pyridoxal-phosphate dependent enzyme [Thermoplasmatota archaeon]
METEIVMNRVGRTPVIRAEKLERKLDVGKIYLKMEGNNPSGHREDRLAYLIIRDALTRGKNTICLGTYGTVGGSLAYLSEFFDVKCIFFMPSKKKALRKKLLVSDRVKVVEYGETYEECVIQSRRVSRKNGWYDANPGLANNMMNMYAFSYIAKELNEQLGEDIENIFCQTSSGSSISGLHMGYKQLWVNEDIDRLPGIFAASTSHGNALIESFGMGKRSIVELDPKIFRETKLNRNVLNWTCFNGQDALNAIYDTGARAIGISDEDLTEMAGWFRKLERKVKFTVPNFYPLAAFIKEARAGAVSKGDNVIILNDGRVNIELKILKKESLGIPYEEFLSVLDTWLVQFTDPVEEIREATDNAFDEGFVIGAFSSGNLVGITVVSNSKWETFFPAYHLSYIATKKDLRGMGIATLLIQKAIELSNGSLSLHVETDNKKAIKLYEKMGLRRKYYRMLYKGPEGL